MSVEDLLQRARPSLLERIDATARARQEGDAETDDVPGFDKLAPLPQPGDPYTLAFASSRHHAVPTIRFLLGNATIRGFSYANFDSYDWLPGEKPGDGPRIVIRFDGLTPAEVVLEGRHLDVLYDLLGHQKVIWVRELPKEKDFNDAADTVVTRTIFRPVEPVRR